MFERIRTILIKEFLQIFRDPSRNLIAFFMPCTKHPCPMGRPHVSHGAADCAQRAERAGIPVRRFTAALIDLDQSVSAGRRPETPPVSSLPSLTQIGAFLQCCPPIPGSSPLSSSPTSS